MRQLQRTGAVALALVVATAVAAACASGSAGKSRPVLTVTRRSPVVVTGRHFSPHLKVHLLLRAVTTQTRTAIPNGGGAFTATFSTVIDRCTNWSVRAAQPGLAPVLIRGSRPECAPAGSP